MRFREIIAESYTETLRSEIINLLAAVSAGGITQVNTPALLKDLQNQGFALEEPMLLELLDQIEIVQSADKETISISTNSQDQIVGTDADEIETDRVDALAKNKSSRDIRSGI